MEIFSSGTFGKRYKRLPKRVKEKAKDQEKIFKDHPFDSRLKTHKLHGKDKEHWAYSIDRKYRIKFVFIGENTVLYLDVGTHDEVY